MTQYPNKLLALAAEALLGNLTTDMSSKTFAANTSLYAPFLMADVFTINTGVTVTAQTLSTVIVANQVIINGTLTASGLYQLATTDLISLFGHLVSSGQTGSGYSVPAAVIGGGGGSGVGANSLGGGALVAEPNPF